MRNKRGEGRKRMPKGDAECCCLVRMTQKLKKKAETAAESEGLSTAFWIRTSMEEKLQRKGNGHD